ncbi:MAG: beta-galactosidase trimerization domain-containing protein [Bacillota bacterium]
MNPDRLLLIADLIPPGPEALEQFDVGAQVEAITRLGFSAQHIEVTDVTVGEAGIAFFDSKHARLNRRDLLKEYRKHHGRRGSWDIVYFNVHWLSGELMPLHPEWFQRDGRGGIIPIPYGSGGYSCINSPFRDWAMEMIREIGMYGVKGIFLDGPVFSPKGCYCDACRAGFKGQHGLEYAPEQMKDPLVFHKVLTFKQESIARFVRDVRKSLKSVNPDAVLYMNGLPLGPGTCGRDNRLVAPWQDALLAEGGFLSGDLRDLPVWKPAATAKWLETQAEGKPTIVAVAGRHGPWNRYLLPAAETWIAYALSVANGAHVWYGIYDANRDDPRMNTVREINRLLSAHSDCLAQTASVARVALVWSLKNANFYQTTAEQLDFVEGKAVLEHRMKSDARRAFNGWFEVLSRSHHLFDVIDDHCLERGGLSRYELVILPNVACMGEKECRSIRDYVAEGGNVIATYDTALWDAWGRPRETHPLKEVFGISETEGAEYLRCDHVALEPSPLTGGIDQSLIPAPHLHIKVVPAPGARAHMHFRKKQPSSYCDLPPKTDHPFLLKNRFGKGTALLFTGNIDAMYETYRFPEHGRLMRNAVDGLSRRDVRMDEESTSLIVNVREKGNRRILHLVNCPHDVGRPIERVKELRDVRISVHTGRRPRSIRTIRGECDLSFSYAEGWVSFQVPEVREYEAAVIDLPGKGDERGSDR